MFNVGSIANWHHSGPKWSILALAGLHCVSEKIVWCMRGPRTFWADSPRMYVPQLCPYTYIMVNEIVFWPPLAVSVYLVGQTGEFAANPAAGNTWCICWPSEYRLQWPSGLKYVDSAFQDWCPSILEGAKAQRLSTQPVKSALGTHSTHNMQGGGPVGACFRL